MMSKTKIVFWMLGLTLSSSVAFAGMVNPDSTPEKAAKEMIELSRCSVTSP